MEIQQLSTLYSVTILKESDIPIIFQLCSKNPQYYKYCPPAVSMDSIQTDMLALPEGKISDDKYYLGFWEDNELLAVMDLILKYPDKNIAFIGFFMINADYQGKGIGSKIVEEACNYLKKDFSFIRLGYVKGNKQSEHFWLKNDFKIIGESAHTKDYTIIIMQKNL